MRLVAMAPLLLTLPGCVSGVIGGRPEPTAEDDDDNIETCAGVSPAPYCGEGGCTCCGSCSPSRELCFAAGWELELGFGQCYSPPVEGTLTATVDGAAFAATEVAAVASTGYVQINGRITRPTSPTTLETLQLTLQLPAQLGTFDCGGMSTALFAYTASHGVVGDTADAWNQLRLTPRPACTFTITAIGEVGERIEGSFAVSLVDRKTRGTLEVTDGTFSVQRVTFP